MRPAVLVILALVVPLVGCESVNEPAPGQPLTPFEPPMEEPSIQQVMERQSPCYRERVRDGKIIDQ